MRFTKMRSEDTGRVLQKAGRIIGFMGMKAALGISWAAQSVWDNRAGIAGGVVGGVKGVYRLGQAVYGAGYSKESFSERIDMINRQSEEYKRLYNRLKLRYTEREMLLDSLGVSVSFTGAYAFTEKIPDEVISAYEAAYPLKAQNLSLEEAAANMDTEELRGLVNGIKGKLFESRYVDYLNDGNLPEGYWAEIAARANNPGWDIAVFDAEGKVAAEMQLKATESVEYIKNAIMKYPEIDIVTTDEVYSHLIMHGVSDHIVNSGISNAELTEVVTEAVSSDTLQLDCGLPVIPMLLIGYCVYRKEHTSSFAKGKEFGERYIKSYLAYLTGGAAAVVTNTWWIGLAAAVGTGVFIGYGRNKFMRIKSLDEIIENNETVLRKMRAKIDL